MVRVQSFLPSIGTFCSNTYLVIDKNNRCVVIDPANHFEEIVNYVETYQLELCAILLTHGHFDHIRCAHYLAKRYNIEIYVSNEDLQLLKDATLNISSMVGEPFIIESDCKLINDNEVLKLINEEIVCLKTPYHTSGSLVYYLPTSHLIFSGDSLFKESIGRSDLPTGCSQFINRSVQKIVNLDEMATIYPGHGEITTIEWEKQHNIYVRRALTSKE